MVDFCRRTSQKQEGYTLVTVVVVSIVLLAILSIVLQYIATLASSSRNITQLIAAQNTTISGLIGASVCEQQDINTISWSDITSANPCAMDGKSSDKIGLNAPIDRQYTSRLISSVSYGSIATITHNFLQKSLQTIGTRQANLLQPARKPTRISTSDTHSCVVAAGRIYCWGRNNYGQLGNGTQAGNTDFHNPVAVDMSSNSSSLKGKVVTDVATGHNFTCALSGSEIHCWGRNNYGQLGNGTKTNSPHPVKMNTLASHNPIQGKSVSQLTTAGNIACVVAGSKIYCWGEVTHLHKGGEDGSSVAMSSNSPIPVQVGHASWGELNSQPVDQIALTHSGICALSLKKLYCWGDVIRQDNFSNPTPNEHKYRILPTFPLWGSTGETRLMYTHLNSKLNENGIASIVAGSHHLCAIDSKAGLICWGGNGLGQLGIGTQAGDNDAYYWQNSYTPAPDISRPDSYVSIPRHEYGVQQVASSGAGWYGFHTCALTNKDNVYCWGSNIAGQIGNGNHSATEQIISPYKVDLHGLQAEQISTSLTDTCAIAGGKVYCWGQTKKGYEPDSTSRNSYEVHGSYITAHPTEINLAHLGVKPEDLRDYTKPANGYCTTSTTRSVYCWGYGSTNNNSLGQIGDGTTINRRTAMSIQGKHSSSPLRSEAFSQVATGLNHACALGGGKVYCWGANNHGQLGNGKTGTPHSPYPALIDTSASSSLRNNLVTYIAAGKDNTCVISEGKIYCWGNNNYRQSSGSSAGGVAAHRPMAIDMSSSHSSLRNKTAVQLALGSEHSCALANDNTIHCWGRNNHGQLGNGTNTDSASPRQVDTAGVLNGKKITTITAGYNHTCAFTSDKLVRCWGANNHGQLGNQATANQNKPVASGVGPSDWAPIKNKTFHSIAAAGDYTCAILTDEVAKIDPHTQPNIYTNCWGVNNRLQLLQGGIANASTIQPGTDSNSSGYRGFSISAHPYGACLLVGGELPCWGDVAGITKERGRIYSPSSSTLKKMQTISTERIFIHPGQ
ncbi:MAG: hypothetical protein Q4B06_02905 [Candidatus Saccharibacteria bacterium]|nr:hypothetical protein [Candidatus Saccharibacteria bacterium]